MAKSLLELAGRIGLKALDAFERNKPKREMRKAKRAIRKKVRRGEPVTIEEMYLVSEKEAEPKLRTSTKAVVGGTFLAQVYVQLVHLIPGDGTVEQLLTTPEAVAFAGVLLAGIVARMSWTATNPGVL